MICADPDCNVTLKEFEKYGGNDLCFSHRMEKLHLEKKRKRMEKAKYMSDEDRKEFLTPNELEEYYNA